VLLTCAVALTTILAGIYSLARSYSRRSRFSRIWACSGWAFRTLCRQRAGCDLAPDVAPLLLSLLRPPCIRESSIALPWGADPQRMASPRSLLPVPYANSRAWIDVAASAVAVWLHWLAYRGWRVHTRPQVNLRPDAFVWAIHLELTPIHAVSRTSLIERLSARGTYIWGTRFQDVVSVPPTIVWWRFAPAVLSPSACGQLKVRRHLQKAIITQPTSRIPGRIWSPLSSSSG